MVGLDASILMHPTVWKASGHIDNFTDPMVDCRECKRRFRADQIDELPWLHFCEATKGNKFTIPAGAACTHCGGRRALCPECGKGDLTAPRQFNLMFKTFMGPVEEDASLTYLRPETAQGIFVNFDNVLQATRKKLPFGIAQIGKAFRNEITPGNFIFRTREFEQMEIEYFVNPHDTVEGRPADEHSHDRWIEACQAWFTEYGLSPDHMRRHEHPQAELAHYAKRTVDILYQFPMGWSELMGIANRTDFDLKQHAKFSGKSLTWFDEDRKEHVVPFVIEPSAGVDRALLAFLLDAYTEEEVRGDKRVVLRFHRELAPIKIAVLPLLKKRGDIVVRGHELRDGLARRWATVYDDTAAIGRLYRRQDEVGTPYCVTVDVKTVGDTEKAEVGDGKVTIRERDSMEQIRVPMDALQDVFGRLLDVGVPWADVAREFPRAVG
jgi:glycyl-tRNA synthetase